MNSSPRGPGTLDESQPRLVSLKTLFHLDSCAVSPSIPSTIKPVPLGEIEDVSTQQALVVKDVIFALLGYEGHYVRFSDRYNPSLVHDRIRGPDFRVAAPLDISLKPVTKKLLRIGKIYLGLAAFAQVYNLVHFGRVNQRLCCEISRVLASFRRLVLALERQFYRNEHFSLASMDNEVQNTCADHLKHLYEIVCAVHAETEQRTPRFVTSTSVSSALSGDISSRDPRFDTFLNSIRTDVSAGANVSSDPNRFDVCKGGLVLRIVEARGKQFEGDSKACSLLSLLFEAISADYVALLNTWLAEGEVDDVFGEFLVKKNDLPKNIFYSNVERYWEELYVIKLDGLIDAFLDKDVQMKVLATGKFLNIFKRCIGSASLGDFPDSVASVPRPENITSLCAQDLHAKMLQFYDRANSLLLKLYFKGYHLGDMLGCLHATYLLSESSKIDAFFDRSLHELGKDKLVVSTVTLTDTFNGLFGFGAAQTRSGLAVKKYQSIRGRVASLLRTFQHFSVDSNNFYDLSEEIISVRSFDAAHTATGDEQASSAIRKVVSQSLKQPLETHSRQNSSEGGGTDKNTVIAAVNIDCALPFPLNLLVGENFVFEFQLIFKLQMILKYAGKIIDASWRDSMYSAVWNYKGFGEPVKKLVLRSRVLIFRMKSFVTALQNYVDHIVIAANFSSLQQCLDHVSLSLDKLRPASRTTRSSSPFKDAPPLTRHANKNRIFDEKIKMSSTLQASSGKFGPAAAQDDVYALSQSIGTYLSNILRDAMITNSQLLQHLRASLALVAEFTSLTGRLKKTVILTDAALLAAFARDYPGKFDTIDMDDTLVRSRITGLNNVITKFWTDFNYSLQAFTQELRVASTENASFMTLKEKLSVL